MTLSDTVIIVVWFNPTRSQISNYLAISRYCHVIAVDNSKYMNYENNDTESFCYIPLNKNAGIAYAMNTGICKAKELGFKYVTFFDQDTMPDMDNIVELRKEFLYIQKSGIKIASIGPCLVNGTTGEEYANYRTSSSEYYQEVEMIMTSSTFTSIEILDAVGYMNAKLFIDFVDHEWCWRANSKGYKIFQTEKSRITHSIGQMSIMFMGYERPISAPFRYYYQFRNSLWLRHCQHAPLPWRKRVIPRLFVELIFIMIYNRPALSYAFKGIKDGLKSEIKQ